MGGRDRWNRDIMCYLECLKTFLMVVTVVWPDQRWGDIFNLYAVLHLIPSDSCIHILIFYYISDALT